MQKSSDVAGLPFLTNKLQSVAFLCGILGSCHIYVGPLDGVRLMPFSGLALCYTGNLPRVSPSLSL